MSLPILCYHRVGPLAEEGRRLNVEPADLAAQVGFFRRRGYRFVLARELADSWPEHAVCLTFDDGYVSTLTYGFETLRSLDVRASVYVVTSLVGRESAWDEGHERPLAGWEALKEAHRDGFEVGNHTRTHARLGELAVEEQIAEIEGAARDLVEQGLPGATLCLPYGSHNDVTTEAMKRSGAPVGLALSRRPARASDDRLLLPRIVVAYGDRLAGLLYRLYVRPNLPTLRRRAHYV